MKFPFEIGEQVRCIDARGSSRMTMGELYMVTGIWETTVLGVTHMVALDMGPGEPNAHVFNIRLERTGGPW